VINFTPCAEQPEKFHIGEEHIVDRREDLQVHSPLVSRQWEHPIETTGPIERQRHNRLSPAERAELNRQFKHAVEVGLIRPNHSEFGTPIPLVRKVDGSLRLCIE
jgi:hypothetical protein